MSTPTRDEIKAAIDYGQQLAVRRILAGDVVRANDAERTEVVRRWRASGRSLNELARLTGWKVERYYTPQRRAA